ncbi:unnamed protein product [Thelazia callipaeda]|uniref:Uncharacterized protein n=1 Tax=Thelazia callipaeda TaxID=103827 RepID=A0A0N5CPT9_THECL|nr:unnamed protein product [Thelazia callipaeda]
MIIRAFVQGIKLETNNSPFNLPSAAIPSVASIPAMNLQTLPTIQMPTWPTLPTFPIMTIVPLTFPTLASLILPTFGHFNHTLNIDWFATSTPNLLNNLSVPTFPTLPSIFTQSPSELP